MNQALDNFLQLVYPSRKIVFGFDTLKKTNPKRVKLVILFSTCSENTKNATKEYASKVGLEVRELDPLQVPRFIGTRNLALISILDGNVALKIKNLMKEGDTYE